MTAYRDAEVVPAPLPDLQPADAEHHRCEACGSVTAKLAFGDSLRGHRAHRCSWLFRWGGCTERRRHWHVCSWECGHGWVIGWAKVQP